MSHLEFPPSEPAVPLARSRRLALIATVALAVSACGGGGGGGGPVGPAPSPTSTATSGGGGSSDNQAAYTCGTSDSPSSAARRSASTSLVRHAPMHGAAATTAPYSGFLAVTYARSFAHGSRALMASRERIAGASLLREYDYAHIGKTTRVLAVPLAARAATEARLRAQPGVLSVGPSGGRRHAFGAAARFTTDPYFVGFPQEIATDGTTYPQTQGVGPYYEAANVEGQWDMHAIGLEHAFGYSVSGGGGAFNANAIGSPNVRLAVIDSGEDTNNDDLGSKIVYQRCFITNAARTQQSTSTFTNDAAGHGTAVAGIAAADFNNALGFVGSGGQTSIYGYRVDPTPDDNCANETSAATDNQCGADPDDIASAVEDAVQQNVDVINLSVGADPCKNGQDSDQNEGNAIADAIAAKIVVVAAAGNDAPHTQALASPACDPGVIAAGASALDDGAPNASGHATGSAQTPVEYVASYSQYGSPASAFRNTSAWGIVAPGGDPIDAKDADDLHWIENVWTTTPYMASSNDKSFEGFCLADYPNEITVNLLNCHTLIAGTSMASPSVAGSAALIISANPTYKDPTLMKQLLCSTSDDIGDPHEGCGRLNVYRAMAKALGDSNPP